MSALITLDSLCFRAPDGRMLIDGLTLAFGRERTGLVGRNGVGKTTLARLILGEVAPLAGDVAVKGRVGVLRQTPTLGDGETLADMLGVRESLTRLQRIEAGAASGDDLDLADWTLPQRIEETLARFGLADIKLTRPASDLSGGQATRVGLAALALDPPDFIVLDEPTNNLDTEARAAVMAFLEVWPHGALVISHDRAVLRRMDRILELTSLGAQLHGGGYDLYAERKAAEEAAAVRDVETAERETARIARATQTARERKARSDAAGRRSRAKNDAPKILLDFKAGRAEASGARLGRLAERQSEEAQRDLEAARARVERIRRLDFDLPPSTLAAGKLVLAFDDVSFAWPGGAPVLDRISFTLVGPERVALLGPNGSGKSTLMSIAVGERAPSSGVVTRGVRAARLDQRAALLRDDETLVENYRRLNRDASVETAHAALARFLFRNVDALKLAGALSGGERLRAALACTLLGSTPPQLVILDEPTNHLDLDSLAAIESALADYDGALLIASHDEDFLEAIGIERDIALSPVRDAPR